MCRLVMMVSGHMADTEEAYTDSELEEEEEEEEYSDEAGDEFGSDEVYVPKTFEDFQTMFKKEFEASVEEEVIKNEVPSEPQSVDVEMEKRVEKELMKVPEKLIVKEPEPELSPDEGPYSMEDEYEREEGDEIEDIDEADDVEEPEDLDELEQPEELSGIDINDQADQMCHILNFRRRRTCR